MPKTRPTRIAAAAPIAVTLSCFAVGVAMLRRPIHCCATVTPQPEFIMAIITVVSGVAAVVVCRRVIDRAWWEWATIIAATGCVLGSFAVAGVAWLFENPCLMPLPQP